MSDEGEAGRGGAAWAAGPVIDWLLDEGRFRPDINELCGALGERLAAAGAPLSRLRLSMRLLHPQLSGITAIWQRDGTLERDLPAHHGMEGRESYIGSPLAFLQERREPFRRRLEAPLTAADHRLLHALKAQGGTDYLALPLLQSGGSVASFVAVTDRRGGFAAADLAAYAQLARSLAPVVEVLTQRALAEAVAAAYIGERSGRRVLAGRIRRGEAERLTAAVWFSDLRGWSRIANRLSPESALAYANAYFELVEGAVSAAGGEVLKLIGDAVLAIFPVEAGPVEAGPVEKGPVEIGRRAREACRAAIAAAEQAQAAARAGAGGEAAAAAGPEGRLAFGVGLHLGEVIYGNVGAPTRLDFTVMGPAVNRAARLEALCRPLGRPIVLSAELAEASGQACEPLGAQPLAGWEEPLAVFAPAGSDRRA